jgi:SulP family sulfate permease
MLPAPVLPSLDAEALRAALPWAVSFTLLGAIESLLSAVVADGMTGRQHRPNAELVAQAVANLGSALFGGFCVTGTIARTATNVRAGSRGPVSGMLHSLFLLAFMLVAAPLAAFIPLAALAGVLAVVAWNMAEKEELWSLVRSSRGDAMVVIVTFLLVVFRDLTEGIVVGFALGGLVFIRRMSEATEVAPHEDAMPEGGDGASGDVLVYRLRGAYFFGAAALLGSVLNRIADTPRAFVLDFSDVPFIDSSGARSVALLGRKVARNGGRLFLTGTSAGVRRVLLSQEVHEPQVSYLPDVAEALEVVRQAKGSAG